MASFLQQAQTRRKRRIMGRVRFNHAAPHPSPPDLPMCSSFSGSHTQTLHTHTHTHAKTRTHEWLTSPGLQPSSEAARRAVRSARVNRTRPMFPHVQLRPTATWLRPARTRTHTHTPTRKNHTSTNVSIFFTTILFLIYLLQLCLRGMLVPSPIARTHRYACTRTHPRTLAKNRLALHNARISLILVANCISHK